MKDEKILHDELMTDEELDNVVGGVGGIISTPKKTTHETSYYTSNHHR